MVNHQIPMRKDKKTYGKTIRLSHGKRWENQWQTIRFPREKMRKPMVNNQIITWEKMGKPMANHQIPMGKIRKMSGQPSDSYKGT